MFYRCFDSKEEVMQAIGDKMFFENNPFDTIKKRTDLNGLQKIQELLVLNQSDTQRDNLNTQAISILKDPRILQTAIEANKRILTPLWFELLEEARMDDSIQTEYIKELWELLPLVNFWLMPSIYPATLEAFETPTVQACIPQMQTGDNIIKGNAVVNQIAAASTLIAPTLGSVCYTAKDTSPFNRKNHGVYGNHYHVCSTFGQIAYGFLFDGFSTAIYLILIPTGVIVCLIGLLTTRFFKKLEMEQTDAK